MTYLGTHEDSGIFPEQEKYITELTKAINPPFTTRWRNRIASRLGFAPSMKMLEANKMLTKQLRKMQIINNPIATRFQGGSGGEAIAYHPNQYEHMFYSVLTNSTARPMLNTRKRELFRQGFEITPKFVKKCKACEADFEYEVKECELCGSFDLRTPNIAEKELLEDLIVEKVNRNNQSLVDVLKELLEDMDITDDCWLAVRKNYMEMDGKIISGIPIELWRVNPAHMAFSVTEHRVIGEYEYTCIDHRMFISSDPFIPCEECGKSLHAVIAVQYEAGMQEIIFRFIAGEIIHSSMYRPSALYGYPGALTLYYDLKLTNKQVKYMADYYDEKKIANAYLMIPTRNVSSVKEHMEEMKLKLQKDPYTIPYTIYDPDSKTVPQLIRMDASPQEMQFMEVREESRNRMGAYWGVAPIMNSDMSAGGGLNNEGMQFTVTNRAMEDAQTTMNNNLISPLTLMFNVMDWDLGLPPSEEQDEVAELDRQLKKDQSALYKQQLGFKVSLLPNGDYRFEQPSEEELAQQQQMQQIGEGNGGPMGEGDPNEQDTPFFNNINPRGAGNQALAENQFQGSPTKPQADHNLVKLLLQKGTPIKTALEVAKDQNGDKYKFNDEIPDWEWSDDYDVKEFLTVTLDEISPHPDFELNDDDILKESPRVRPETLAYYFNETDEMQPLVVDESYNLLDGYHRHYVLKNMDQKDVRVVVVGAKSLAKMYKFFLAKVKDHLRAPPGGVNIHGQFYPGGQFIPQEVIDAMSDEEKQAVQQGQDVGGEPGQEEKEGDIEEYRKEVVNERQIELNEYNSMLMQTNIELEGLNTRRDKLYEANENLRNVLNRTVKQQNRKDEINWELWEISDKITQTESEATKINVKIENTLKRMNNPDYDLADRLSEIDEIIHAALKNDTMKKKYPRWIKREQKDLDKINVAIVKKDASLYDVDFVEDTWEETEPVLLEMKGYMEINIKEYKESLEQTDETSLDETLSKYNEEHKALRDLSIKKDGEHWPYYKNNEMKTVQDLSELKEAVMNQDTLYIENLFKEELAWAMERCEISKDLLPYGEIRLDIVADPNISYIGQTQFSDNTITLNLPLIQKITESGFNVVVLQEAIRHEIAHFLTDLKTYPNYHQLQEEYRMLDFDIGAYRSKPDKQREMKQRMITIVKTIDSYDSQKMASFNSNREDTSFREGHGQDWQDTMYVLFGSKPRHRMAGGATLPVRS